MNNFGEEFLLDEVFCDCSTYMDEPKSAMTEFLTIPHRRLIESIQEKNEGKGHTVALLMALARARIENSSASDLSTSFQDDHHRLEGREHRTQPEINSILLETGLAGFLQQRDWSVGRKDSAPLISEGAVRRLTATVSEETGLVSLREIEKAVFAFQEKYKVDFNGHSPVHFRLGPGDGEDMDRARIQSNFVQIGYANRFYTTLFNLFRGFLKEDKNQIVLLEFVEYLSTTILFAINSEKYGLRENEYLVKTLLDTGENINDLKKILPFLRDYRIFQEESETFFIPRGGEFPDDIAYKQVSPECEKLIRECLAHPKQFFQRYFKNELFSDDLKKHLHFFPNNIILGNFEEIDQVLPESPLFSLVSSIRATSHLESDEYKKLIFSITKRLFPGGAITDDGIRESYTRDLRLFFLHNPEYKAWIILHMGTGVRSLFIQRGIKDETTGEFHFFSEEERKKLLPPESVFLDITEQSEKYETPYDILKKSFPEEYVRANLRSQISFSLIEGNLRESAFFCDENGDIRYDDSRTKYSLESYQKARFTFQGVHDEIEDLLEGLFSSSEWKEKRNSKTLADFAIFSEEILSKLEEKMPIFKKSLRDHDTRVSQTVLNAVVPSHEVTDYSYPLLSQSRETKGYKLPKTANLPRNIGIPLLETHQILQQKYQRILEDFNFLTEKRGSSPLFLVEFGDCFTNTPLKNFFQRIFKSEYQNIHFHSVNMQDPSTYPPIEENAFYCIGGSLSDAYNPDGNLFGKRFLQPLVRKILDGKNIRGMGICFGHQSIGKAFDRVIGEERNQEMQYNIVQEGPLEFGYKKIEVKSRISGITDSLPKYFSAMNTRSGYFFPSDWMREEMAMPDGLASVLFNYENTVHKNSPAGILYGPKENPFFITTQFHPELTPDTQTVVSETLQNGLYDAMRSSHYIGNEALSKIVDPTPNDYLTVSEFIDSVYPFAVFKREKGKEKEPWVKNGVADALFIPIFQKIIGELCRSLQLS